VWGSCHPAHELLPLQAVLAQDVANGVSHLAGVLAAMCRNRSSRCEKFASQHVDHSADCLMMIEGDVRLVAGAAGGL
jgi:hypothetical protein